MTFRDREVWTKETFGYNSVNVGDYVDADIVMDAMDCLPPATMKLSCAQLGEPYSHRIDPEKNKLRPIYATFKVVDGNFSHGIWEFCGYCFKGETMERGEDSVYV